MCRSRFDWRDPRSSSRARGWGERVRGSRVPRARGFPVSAAADFGRPRRKRARRSPRATWYSGKPPGVEPDAKIRHRGKERGRARCRTGSSSRARGRAAPDTSRTPLPLLNAGFQRRRHHGFAGPRVCVWRQERARESVPLRNTTACMVEPDRGCRPTPGTPAIASDAQGPRCPRTVRP
jgi:hypothetical protein